MNEEKPMRIGKYTVTTSTGSNEKGEFFGSAHLLGDEGGETRAVEKQFDKPCTSEDEAKQHAIEQVQIRIRDGRI